MIPAGPGGEIALPELAAGSLFVIGVFGVTAVGNVPLNNQLARIEPGDAASSEFWQN